MVAVEMMMMDGTLALVANWRETVMATRLRFGDLGTKAVSVALSVTEKGEAEPPRGVSARE